MAGATLCAAACAAGCTTSPTAAANWSALAGPSGLPSVTVLKAQPGATVRALWQGARLNSLTFDGGALIGAFSEGKGPARVGAVAAVTGRPLWTASVAGTEILHLIPAGPVVIVESGGSPRVQRTDQRGVNTGPFVDFYSALDTATGAIRWRAPSDEKGQSPAAAVAGNALVTGNAAGVLTARTVSTGAVAWRLPWPAECGSAASNDVVDAGQKVSANGALLVVSDDCGSHSLVSRLDPATGVAIWTWRTPAKAFLRVFATASDGGLVLLWGTSDGPATRRLTPVYAWPAAISRPTSSLALALDASTGRPRWAELGGPAVFAGAPEAFLPVGGALCETVTVGVECRNDVTGAATMPGRPSGMTVQDTPTVWGDGTAAAGGGLVAQTERSGAAGITLRVVHVAGGATAATVRLGFPPRAYGGDARQAFVIGGEPLGPGKLLILLRRNDLQDAPVLAITVTA
jgi:hypothetical protein